MKKEVKKQYKQVVKDAILVPVKAEGQ